MNSYKLDTSYIKEGVEFMIGPTGSEDFDKTCVHVPQYEELIFTSEVLNSDKWCIKAKKDGEIITIGNSMFIENILTWINIAEKEEAFL